MTALLIVSGIGLYLMAGIAALLLFDVLTHRIRERLVHTVGEARGVMVPSGVFLGQRTGTIVVILILVVFWPGVLCSALLPKQKGGKD